RGAVGTGNCKTCMEMKQAPTQVTRSLYFRILAPLVPIVILMALLGSVVFSLGLSTARHYADERVHEDIGRNAREIYNLCDMAMQESLLDGDLGGVRIRKGRTLG